MRLTSARQSSGRRPRHRGGLWLAVALACGIAKPCSAHENTPAVLALKEIAPGRFQVRWSPPVPAVSDLKLHFPRTCQINGQSSIASEDSALKLPCVLDCGAASLAGSIQFEAAGAALGRVGVSVVRHDHSEALYFTEGSPPTVELGGTASGDRPLQVLRDYVGIGLSHILQGFDHLLFVLGLLLLVQGWRSLLATVSAFTLAHSLTLAAASLNWIALPSGPVEICIALSVLLLALEVTRGVDTATRRWPWMVAFGFGLLHGLGFAGALSEVGLPEQAVALSLLGFNLGVELGQLLVVGLVFLGYRLLRNYPAAKQSAVWIGTWALGVCSVFWLLERVEAWLGGFGI
jgi:hydrogenase/urease accessory protein HupE